MKRFSFMMGLVAATMVAAPLAAQSRNSGPWWDPSNTGQRTDTRNGSVYGRDGSVYDNGTHGRNTRVDGQWHLAGRDRNGNNVYVRTRYDSNGNVVQEAAHRNILGRYSVFDRQVVQNANNRNNRVYGRNGRNDRNDNDRNNDGWEDSNGRDRNDRWDQNNGHDNGKHNGQTKSKNKNKGRRD
ncbi:MAG: hypothetical protein ABI556_10420 [Gemmatimonadales bacterium]